MDRRAFVKGTVAASAAAALGAGGVVGARSLVPLREEAGPPVAYYGLHRVDGPAPRGVPLIPLVLGRRGEFEGRPRLDALPEGATVAGDVLAWYRYCGHDAAPGLREDYDGDSVLRYFVPPNARDAWFAPRAGEPLRPEHFEVGAAAHFAWRSEGATGADVLTGLLTLASPGTVAAHRGRLVPPARRLVPADERALRDLFLVEAAAGTARRGRGPEDASSEARGTFVAASTFCTHFCCLPSWWREAEKQARAEGAEGAMFCTCHNSEYRPTEIVRYEYRPG